MVPWFPSGTCITHLVQIFASMFGCNESKRVSSVRPRSDGAHLANHWCFNAAKTPREMLLEHTCAPILLSLYDPSHVDSSIAPRLIEGRSFCNFSTSALRRCPKCVDEDIGRQGYAVARILHQMPQVLRCFDHGVPLQEQCASCLNTYRLFPRSNRAFCDLRHCPACGSEVGMDLRQNDSQGRALFCSTLKMAFQMRANILRPVERAAIFHELRAAINVNTDRMLASLWNVATLEDAAEQCGVSPNLLRHVFTHPLVAPHPFAAIAAISAAQFFLKQKSGAYISCDDYRALVWTPFRLRSLGMDKSMARGRSGVTEPDVWKAAEAIAARGERPTVERVRAELGNTGSPNTITPKLTSWFLSLHKRLSQAGLEPLPAPPVTGGDDDELATIVTAGVRGIVEPILRKAEERAWQALQRERDEVERSRVDLAVQLDEFAHREEGFVRAHTMLQESLASAKQSEIDLRDRLKEAQARAGRFEVDLATTVAKLEAARTKHASVVTECGQATRALEARHADIELRLLGDIDRAREVSRQAAAASEREAARCERMEVRLGKVQDESRAAQLAFEQERRELHHAMSVQAAKLTESQQQTAEVQAQLAAIRSQLDQCQAHLQREISQHAGTRALLAQALTRATNKRPHAGSESPNPAEHD